MPAIEVVGLTKEYPLAGKASMEPLREVVAGRLRHPIRARSKAPRETFRAVDDVSFTVEPGEIVGIIGRNGAGKSTLLKVLSRIVHPTSGRATLVGRVGSLLEVGTGFHPELSGRENIYFNGALLGMKRREIVRRFDEIVEFAGVGRFLDTPIKRYSSGMSVRLAFAVAAHLEPEILFIDEVLAVGDARFQRKCLDKMQEVGRSGRTVLFVSHNMPAVTRLCPRTIALHAGRIEDDGVTSSVVGRYLRSDLGTTARRTWTAENAPGDHIARLREMAVRTSGELSEVVDVGDNIDIEVSYELIERAPVLVHVHLLNEEGVHIFVGIEPRQACTALREPGYYRTVARIPRDVLTEGTVIVGASLTNHENMTGHFFEHDAVAFQVKDGAPEHSTRAGFPGSIPGLVRPRLAWQTSALSL